MKAKSRLQSSAPESISLEQKETFASRRTPGSQNSHSSSYVLRYLKRLPLLVLSGLFFYGVFYVFTQVSPENIQNELIPNTYLPLLIIFFLANWFLFSFLTLTSRRSLIISLCLTLLLFFRLQTIFTPTLVGLTILGCVSYVFLVSYLHHT